MFDLSEPKMKDKDSLVLDYRENHTKTNFFDVKERKPYILYYVPDTFDIRLLFLVIKS